MTREEFTQGYCERSKLDLQDLERFEQFVAACDCAQGSCKGWQMVSAGHAGTLVDLGELDPAEIPEKYRTR